MQSHRAMSLFMQLSEVFLVVSSSSSWEARERDPCLSSGGYAESHSPFSCLSPILPPPGGAPTSQTEIPA